MKTRLPAERMEQSLSCIPQDILEANIYKDLNKTELGSLSVSCHFFYESTERYKKLLVDAIPRNLQQMNCNKRVFNGEGEYKEIARWKNTLLILSEGSIQAFDVYTGEPLWTCESTKELDRFIGKLWVMQNGNILCYCSNPELYIKDILVVIDIKTGNVLEKIDEKMLFMRELIQVVGNQIILKLKDSISFWDLANKKTINHPIQGLGECDDETIFLANEHFIVDISFTSYFTAITIIQYQSSELIHINRHYRFRTRISSAAITNHLLICGEESGSGFIFDMEQGKIIEKYQFPDGILPTYGTERFVSSVAVNEQYAFMTSSFNHVIAFNRQDNQIHLLDKSGHGHFFLQDNMLFIQAHGYLTIDPLNIRTFFHIWNIESMKKVNTFVGTYGQWHNGELLLLSDYHDLTAIHYDFKVLHQGEILAEEYKASLNKIVVC